MPQLDLQQLQQLFTTAFPNLQRAAYDQHPALLVWDADRILERLAAELPSYTGPLLEPEPFEQWAEAFVRHEAERYRITEKLLTEHRRVIFAAIHKGMRGTFQQRHITADDLFAEVACLILKEAHSLAQPGTAKITTRLTAMAKEHVWLYYGSKCSNRHGAVTRLLARGGSFQECEVFSDMELAAMKEAEEKLAA